LSTTRRPLGNMRGDTSKYLTRRQADEESLEHIYST
jgi:hypothetical protein